MFKTPSLKILLALMPCFFNTLWGMDTSVENIKEETKASRLMELEQKTHYRNDQSCLCFPSCCPRLCSLEKPKSGDAVKCTTIHLEIGDNHFNYAPRNNIFSCEYNAIYESSNHIRVITPHSDFCWENEPYWYQCFCCVMTAGMYKLEAHYPSIFEYIPR